MTRPDQEMRQRALVRATLEEHGFASSPIGSFDVADRVRIAVVDEGADAERVAELLVVGGYATPEDRDETRAVAASLVARLGGPQ